MFGLPTGYITRTAVYRDQVSGLGIYNSFLRNKVVLNEKDAKDVVAKATMAHILSRTSVQLQQLHSQTVQFHCQHSVATDAKQAYIPICGYNTKKMNAQLRGFYLQH